MPESRSHSKWHFLPLSLLALSVFLLLFIFRNADDNRLTSWEWAFAETKLLWCMFSVLAGPIPVYYLLKSPVARQKPSFFLFLISFGVSALFWAVPEVIVDTSRYFAQAKHLELYGVSYFFSEWGHKIHAWTDLPLVPFLYGLVFKLSGESRAMIQVLNSSLFAAAVVTTYLIGKSLWDEETGFLSGVLLLGVPYIYSQTPLMLVDVPTMFFLTFAVYAFIRALQNGGPWLAVSTGAVFCAVFSKYSAWMMLSVLGVIFFVFLITGGQQSAVSSQPKQTLPSCDRNIIIRRTAFITIMSVVLTGIVFLWKSDVILHQISFLREYQAPGLRRWGESFLSTFLYQIHPFITIAGSFSLYLAVKKKDARYIIICWLVLLIAVFQIRRSRYILIIFPMITLMASYGFQAIRDMRLRRYTVSCVIAASLTVALLAYLPFLKSMSMVNFQKAGEFINTLDAESIEVLAVSSGTSALNASIGVPILDLYTEKVITYYNDKPPTVPFRNIETSPLRFTWEYKNPEYYQPDRKKSLTNMPVIVISNYGDKEYPEHIMQKIRGYRKVRSFETTTGIFRYSPVVAVYLPET